MSNISVSEQYFELNEFSNSLDYLKKTSGFLIEEGDQFRYKWATLSLFHALYGFMLTALGGGMNYARVIDFKRMPRQLKEQLQWINEIENTCKNIPVAETRGIEELKNKIIDKYHNSGKAKLIGFEEALKRIQKCERIKQYGGDSKKIVLSANEKENLKLLFLVRNEFLHYLPMLKIYPTDTFLRIFRDAVATIRKLCDSGNLWFYDDLPTIESEISKLEELLNKTKL